MTKSYENTSHCLQCQKSGNSINDSVITDMNQQLRIFKETSHTFLTISFYALFHILKCFFFFPSCFAGLRNDPIIVIVSFKKTHTYVSVISPLDSCPSIISWKSMFSFRNIKHCQRNLKNINPKGCKFKREYEKTNKQTNPKCLKNSFLS